MHHSRCTVTDQTRSILGAPRHWGRWLDRLGSLVERTVSEMEGLFTPGQWNALASRSEGVDNFGFAAFGHPELILQGAVTQMSHQDNRHNSRDGISPLIKSLDPFRCWVLIDTLALYWEYAAAYEELPTGVEWWTLKWRIKFVNSLRS